MATKQTTSTEKNEPDHRADVPGAYLGTDGAGWDHHFEMARRLVTIADGDERRTFRLPADKGLVDWGLEMLDEHDAYWQEIKVDSPQREWLTGELPVGEFPEPDIDVVVEGER